MPSILFHACDTMNNTHSKLISTLIVLYIALSCFLQVNSFSSSTTTSKSHRKRTNININTNINIHKKKKVKKNKGKPITKSDSQNSKSTNDNNQNVAQKKKMYTEEQLSKMTISQAVQESSTCTQLLQTAKRMWLPTDEDLAPYLRTQTVHHEKRIKAASQFLTRFGDLINDDDIDVGHLWKDATENGWRRAILASYISFDGIENTRNELKYVHMSLLGLHSVIGFTRTIANVEIMDEDIVSSIQGWIQKAELYAWDFTLREAVEVRWAINGILTRTNINDTIPNLNERISKLPFDILPSCVNWNVFLDKEEQNSEIVMQKLLNDIPFQFDKILTRSGANVVERRGTAWVANENIGALAYR